MQWTTWKAPSWSSIWPPSAAAAIAAAAAETSQTAALNQSRRGAGNKEESASSLHCKNSRGQPEIPSCASLLKTNGPAGSRLHSSLESFLKNKESKTKEGETENAQQARKRIPAVFTLFSFHLNLFLGSFINKLGLSWISKKNPTSRRRTETLRRRLWGDEFSSDRVPAGDLQVSLRVWGDRKQTNTAFVSGPADWHVPRPWFVYHRWFPGRQRWRTAVLTADGQTTER